MKKSAISLFANLPQAENNQVNAAPLSKENISQENSNEKLDSILKESASSQGENETEEQSGDNNDNSEFVKNILKASSVENGVQDDEASDENQTEKAERTEEVKPKAVKKANPLFAELAPSPPGSSEDTPNLRGYKFPDLS